ncbi:MAG: tRNA uridine-5-carboxymethylaminomethyl(34) synthesis GTPase MnmE [Bacteroidales bacterium]|nr:tRNA uridine-5-carboxymethylaminomethyl(34) synthesis GTPase MnmE [Bacteroidales bacterium]MBQ2912071.1 tRNA uridine-5-carboxymethylaminomethyl(34) synthesis GTPase MnmE [Bacteroidales bacterium]
MEFLNRNICALATPAGMGAIAIIRLSGEETPEIVGKIFAPAGGKAPLPYTMRFGAIKDGERLIDECMVVTFQGPHSYTGENSAEIYCHGSQYIVQEILKLLLEHGVKMAEPGEFSKRAFLNGKMDLAQTEAVADLIASETEAAHRIALDQMKGGFSGELKIMRQDLLNLVSLMELELDFSEEEVEFADRSQLSALLAQVSQRVGQLIESFSLGNVIKNGVPVAIVGATNTGKSTLLNTLVGEERAIVSNIHGTTRDVIEDTMNLGGITFRFIDTAGIRETKETIEIIGIERTFQKLRSASVVILVLDATRPENFESSLENLTDKVSSRQQLIILLNKMDEISIAGVDTQVDLIKDLCVKNTLGPIAVLPISAKKGLGIDALQSVLVESQKALSSSAAAGGTLVSNIRHYQALMDAQIALDRVEDGLASDLATDLVAQDIREALYHLGSIVGEINTEEVLGNIFGKFCIGK